MSRYFPTPRRCLALFLLLAQTAAAASLLSSLQTATSQSTAVAAVPAAFHPRDVRGLNLPNMRPGSNSNSGNFLQGKFVYEYSDEYFAKIRNDGINSLRIGLNVETANDADTLEKILSYANVFLASPSTGSGDGVGEGVAASADGIVILCMWDTLNDAENASVLAGKSNSHGDGRVKDVKAMGAAWGEVKRTIDASPILGSSGKDRIFYEIFNEPYGYSDEYEAQAYVYEMTQIALLANLPMGRVILDGMGYADNIKSIMGYWPGWLAYHVYPNWVSSNPTQGAFSEKVKEQLWTRDNTSSWSQNWLSDRTFITEFGSDLTKLGWEDPSSTDADVNMMRGLHDAVVELNSNGHKIAGTFYWHGWENGDSYSFPLKTGPYGWDNSAGRDKVQKIQKGAVARCEQ